MRRGIVALALFAIVTPGQVDERSAAAFVRGLQQAVARDDRRAVAAMIRYPLTVFAGGVRIPVSDASDLERSYEAVFSPTLKLVIAQATLPGKGRPAGSGAIVIGTDRVVIAGDAVEIELVGGRLLITGIHAPLTAAAPRSGGSKNQGAHPPRRISIGFGRIEHLGTLRPSGRDAYLLSARKNQMLDLRVTGVSGRDVVLEIVNNRTHAPIDAKTRAGVRSWVGRVPEDADYRIEVVRLTSRGAADLPYTLLVSLR
jgi:hypothetical protein